MIHKEEIFLTASYEARLTHTLNERAAREFHILKNRVENVAFSVVQCSAVQCRQPLSLTRFTSDKSLRERHVLGGHINDVTCPLCIDVTKSMNKKKIKES